MEQDIESIFKSANVLKSFVLKKQLSTELKKTLRAVRVQLLYAVVYLIRRGTGFRKSRFPRNLTVHILIFELVCFDCTKHL